jgi:hypothetical protein
MKSCWPVSQPMERRQLRLLIAATPKTGNTWLKYLLSEVYSIPIVNIPMYPTSADFAALGTSWIGHQHVLPTDDVLSTIKKQGIGVITMIRHPADVLVSYYHHIKALLRRGEQLAPGAASMMGDDLQGPGEHTLRFAQEAFAGILLYSVAWLPEADAVVRFEDMLTNPVNELLRVCAVFDPVTEAQAKVAVALCGLSMLRRKIKNLSGHFRNGSSQFNVASDRLPERIMRTLETQEPYPEFYRALGYDPEDKSPVALFDYSTVNPFTNHQRFSNSVPIPDVAIEMYLREGGKARERWPMPWEVDVADSFYSYLLQVVDGGFPAITRLAQWIYDHRPDLQSYAPDCRGVDRLRFVEWIMYTGSNEYLIHQSLFLPTIRSMIDAVVLNRVSADRTRGRDGGSTISGPARTAAR